MAQTMSEIMNPSATARDQAFPDAPTAWDREAARKAAQAEGLEWTPDHWEVVRSLQGWFETHEQPQVRDLHDALDEAFHAKGGIRYLYQILPGGPVAQGCRIAGLEPPTGAADPSFGSVQ